MENKSNFAATAAKETCDLSKAEIGHIEKCTKNVGENGRYSTLTIDLDMLHSPNTTVIQENDLSILKKKKKLSTIDLEMASLYEETVLKLWSTDPIFRGY